LGLSISADLIYLDAAHSYHEVLADIRAFWPLVRQGGVMFGDDFEVTWPGVIRIVHEWGEEVGLNPQHMTALASTPSGPAPNTKWTFKNQSQRRTLSVAPCNLANHEILPDLLRTSVDQRFPGGLDHHSRPRTPIDVPEICQLSAGSGLSRAPNACAKALFESF
jgi:hypothetical protein